MTAAQRFKKALQLENGDVIVNGDSLVDFLHAVDRVVVTAMAMENRSIELSVALLDLRDQAVETEKTIR